MRIKATLRLAVLALLAVAGARMAVAQQGGGAPATPPPPPLTLTSSSFSDGSMLGEKYSCNAKPAAVSPALAWSNAPKETASFAVIAHDLEPRPRKGFEDNLHWMIWNIPATATSLPEGVPTASAKLPDGSEQSNGTPGSATPGYRGPCPPTGVALPHHYVFELFALDQKLDLPQGVSRAELTKAMDGHIIGHAVQVALFHR